MQRIWKQKNKTQISNPTRFANYQWDPNQVQERSSNLMRKLCQLRADWNLPEKITQIPLLDHKEYYTPAVSFLNTVIAEHRPICVCLDYDCDGQTAGACLITCLRAAGANVTWVVPNRLTHGYGLNVELIREHAPDASVLVTVDNGITNAEQIRQLKALGYQVVLTDHHNPQGEIPSADYVIDPKCEDEHDDEYQVSGGWVGAKLGLLVLEAFKPRTSPEFKQILSYCCCLVSIGIVSDVIELTPKITTQLRIGLAELNHTSHSGLQALKASCNLNPCDGCTSTFIGYYLAPKLNAAGRMGCAELGVELLLNDTDAIGDSTAARQATKLQYLNADRKIIEQDIYVMAKSKAKDEVDKYHSVAIVHSPNWHKGVIGVIAARLVEELGVPVIVLTGMGDLEGSGRAPVGINLFEAVSSCSDILTRFGGHDSALGVSLTQDKLEDFKVKLSKYLNAHISDVVIEYDAETALEELWDVRWLVYLQMLEPYGNGNAKPILYIPSVRVTRTEKKKDTVYLNIVDDATCDWLKISKYRGSDEWLSYDGCVIDVLITPNLNTRFSKTMIEYNIIDLRIGN